MAVMRADKANIEIHLPAEYLGKKTGTCASHMDVKLFKEAWDESLKDDRKVQESREKGARLEPEKKHQLRFDLARAAIDKGAVIMKDFSSKTSVKKSRDQSVRSGVVRSWFLVASLVFSQPGRPCCSGDRFRRHLPTTRVGRARRGRWREAAFTQVLLWIPRSFLF